MKLNRMSIVLLAGLGLVGVLAASVVAQDRANRGERRGMLGQRFGERMRERGAKARAFVRGLDLSQAQKEQALVVAHAAEPVVRELHKEIAKEKVKREGPQSGDGARGEMREKVKQLRLNAFHQIEPQVRALIASLTPEQRAKLEAVAQKHGKTLDEDRLAKRMAFWLSRPMAAPMLEARLGR